MSLVSLIPCFSLFRVLVTICAAIALATGGASAQEPVKDQAKCYTTWDENYFYAGFKVDSPDVRGTHKAPNAEVTGDDSITIYLDVSDKSGSKVNKGCFSMAVSVAGGARFCVGNEAGVMEPTTVWKFKYGVNVQGTLNNPDDVDQGYSIEMAIPWDLMGLKPRQVGDMMRFNLVMRRHDAKPGEFIGLSTRVTTEGDLLDPSKWMSLVNTAYSFGAVMPGADKLVSPKSVVRPPLVNGVLDTGEWSKNAMFAIDLPTPEGFVYEAKFPVQHLVFTPFYYWYQADPRKSAPFAHIVAPDGALQLQDLPIKGIGPWFSSDRVQWHKEQLADMTAAGIDVVLPVYSGDKRSRAAFATKGLDCLVAALAELRTEGKAHPQVGMLFDTTSMQLAYDGKQPSLKDEEVKRAFYGMIKSFFDRVPPESRAFAQTGKPNAGRPGCVIFLEASGYFSDLDESFVSYANEQFDKDFGCPLIWVASDDYGAKAMCFDGFCASEAGVGANCDGIGRLKICPVGAGFDDSAIAPVGKARIRSRMAGETYDADWATATTNGAQWVVCDSWNQFHDGSDLGASREYGRKYIDATAANVKRFAGAKDIDVLYLRCDLPRVMPPKQFTQAEVSIKNTGSLPWRASEGYALAYRWYKAGRYLCESKVRRALDRDVAPGETATMVIGVATVNEKNQALADGDCEVRFEMVRNSDGKWFSALGAQPLIMPVTIGATEQWKASYLTCDAPVMLASGETYTAKARVRNDGTETWKKSSVKLGCRLYRVSNYTHDNANESAEEVPIKNVRALLQKDCRPGEIAEFVFPLNLVGKDTKPISSWSPDQPWSYELRFDVHNGQAWLSEVGSRAFCRTVDVFDQDWAARIVDSNIPAKLAAGQVFDAKVVIRNVGAVAWDKKRTRISYHWFHLDGTQMQWDNPATPIVADIKPGWPVVATAKIKAPEYDGRYILAWDVKIDDTWLSTLPLTRGGDLLPVFVEVSGGKLNLIDLSAIADTGAASLDTNRTAGDFDGTGLSFPAEFIPPDAGPVDDASRVYPAGYQRDRESRPDGRVSFLFPDKLSGAKSAVSCGGQNIEAMQAKCLALHVLGASSNAQASGDLTLNYTDGAATAPLAMSDWTTGPKLGEEVGCAVRHLHSHGGDEPGRPAYLYHYVIPLDRGRTLASITLPNSPSMKIVALTLERVSLPPLASP